MNYKTFYKPALSLLLFAAIIAGGTAYAASPKLKVESTSEIVVTKTVDGKDVEERVPADKTKPGDVLYFKMTYTNSGDGDARDARIVDPVPNHTVYLLGSADGENTDITCSVDGGRTYQKPPIYVTEKLPDGKTVRRLADASSYTHIKWVLGPVKPGQTGTVGFKAQVE